MIVSKHFHSDLEVYLFASTDDRPHEPRNLVSSHLTLRSVVAGADGGACGHRRRGALMAGVDYAVYTLRLDSYGRNYSNYKVRLSLCTDQSRIILLL